MERCGIILLRAWIVGCFLFNQGAMASSNQGIVYQGKIVRPDGTTLDSGTVQFTLSVYSPSPSQCLLYSETQSVPMSGSKGMFALTLGSGTRTDGGAHPFAQIFTNGAVFSGVSCAVSNSYTGGSTDDRSLAVSFVDNGVTVALSPIEIKSVPFAMQAHQIDGWGLNDLVKVSTIGSPTTFTTTEMANVKSMAGVVCTTNQMLKFNGTAWTCVAEPTGGGGGGTTSPLTTKGDLYVHTGTAQARLPVGTNGQVLQADSTQATGLKWAAAAAGSLTSVDVAVPTYMTSSGGPLTASGTITVGFGSQTAKTVFAAPNGANGAPLFRALQISDLRSSVLGPFLTNVTSCGAGEALTYDATNDNISCAAIAVSVSNAASLANGKIWLGDSSGKAQAVTLSGDATVSNTGVVALKSTGTAGTFAKVTTDAQGRVTAGSGLAASDVTTALTYTPVNKAGDTMSGSLAMGGFNITAAGNISISADKYLNFGQHTGDPVTTSWTATEKGRTWFNTTSNVLKFWDGAAVQIVGAGGGGGGSGGITALTGDVTASGTGSIAATVANVGGVTAANVASGATLANAAVSTNTASTIVRRDVAGSFAAQDISLVNLTASGDATAGAIRASKQLSSVSYSGSSDAIDWNNGNVQTTSSTCQGLSFANMQDGGTYTLIVTDVGATGCVFPTNINGATAVNWRGQPTLVSHLRVGGSHTVYTILRAGASMYVSWISGF